MNKFFAAFFLMFCMVVSAAAQETGACQDALKRFNALPETRPYMNDAFAYAVFPTIGKGGMVIGGGYGNGCVYRNGVYTGQVAMGQLSVGFQLGGQAFSQLIIMQNEEIYNSFTSGTFEFGADASAVAITAGAQAGAGTKGASSSAGGTPGSTNAGPAAWFRGMAVFTITKGGLMYEASISGQSFKFHPAGGS